jgi:hypothetical protein
MGSHRGPPGRGRRRSDDGLTRRRAGPLGRGLSKREGTAWGAHARAGPSRAS